MEYKIIKEPFGLLEVTLSRSEKVIAEAGSLVYIKGNIQIKTKTRKGGLFQKFKLKAVGRESFFVNEYEAQEDGCQLGLTGQTVGDIFTLSLSPEEGLILQSGSYIASTPGILLDTEWQGFTKGIFGSSLFMLKVSGQGELFANVYGGIIKRELSSTEKILIDNYHLVAMGSNANYEIKRLGGLKTNILGGEGFVTEVTGPGIVYFQTKNLKELVSYLGLYTKSSGSSLEFKIG
jgi:uncharacterized protein (TIGR00266 family)